MIINKLKFYTKIGVITGLIVLIIKILLPLFRQAKGVKM